MTNAERNELLIRLETAQMNYAPYLKNLRVTEAYEKEKEQFEQTLNELGSQKEEFTTLLGKDDWESFAPNLKPSDHSSINTIENRIETLKKERENAISKDFQKPALELVSDLEELDERIKAIDTEIRSKNKSLRSSYKKSLIENNYTKYGNYVETSNNLQEEIKGLEAEKVELEKKKKRISESLEKCIEADNTTVMSIVAKENELVETKEKQVKRVKKEINEEIQKLDGKMNVANDNLNQLIQKKGARYQAAKEAIENVKAKEYFESVKADIEAICGQLGVEVSYEPNGLQPKVQQVEEVKAEEPTVEEKVEASNERRLFGFNPENYKTIKVLSRALQVIKDTAKIVRHPVAALEGTIKYVNEELPKNMGVSDYVDYALNINEQAKEFKNLKLEEMKQSEEQEEVQPIELPEEVTTTPESTEEPQKEEPEMEEIVPITLTPTILEEEKEVEPIAPESSEPVENEEVKADFENGVQLFEQGLNALNKVVFVNGDAPIKNAKMKAELVNVLAQHQIIEKMQKLVDSMNQMIQPAEVSEEVEETKGKSL